MGTYTQALMVTGNDGVNVGTGAGQVPPVGTVYNVIYRESDAHFFLYTSMPSDSGSQVSVIEVKDGRSHPQRIDVHRRLETRREQGAFGRRRLPFRTRHHSCPVGSTDFLPDVQIQAISSVTTSTREGRPDRIRRRRRLHPMGSVRHRE